MMEVRYVTAPFDNKVKHDLRMASFTWKMSVKPVFYLGLVNLLTLIKHAWDWLWPRHENSCGALLRQLLSSIAPTAPVSQEIQITESTTAVGQARKTTNSDRQGRCKPTQIHQEQTLCAVLVFKHIHNPLLYQYKPNKSPLQQCIFHSQRGGDLLLEGFLSSTAVSNAVFPSSFPVCFCQTCFLMTPVAAFPHVICLFVRQKATWRLTASAWH